MKKMIQTIKRPVYWIPRILLLALCLLHEKTKYHTARSITELFYWPDGFCADMIVLALFGIVAAWCIWMDVKAIYEAGNDNATEGSL